MTDKKPESKLVGRPGAALILGVSRQRVTVLETRKGFPKPIDYLFGEDRPVWRRRQIEAYRDKREKAAAA